MRQLSNAVYKPGRVHFAAPTMLGPFLGHVTDRTAKIWLQLDLAEAEVSRTVYLTVSTDGTAPADQPRHAMVLSQETFGAQSISITGLNPDTLYFYRLWED